MDMTEPAEDSEDMWWYLTNRRKDKTDARNADAYCITEILFAKRLLDFIEEFPRKDPDVGYAKAVIRLTEMCYTASPCMYLRGIVDIKPDIVTRLDKKYGTVWGTCLTIGCHDHGRARVMSIDLNGNFATVNMQGSAFRMRFGDNLEVLYRRFLKANPDPPGDGVKWKFTVNPKGLGYCPPAPTRLDPAWGRVKEKSDVWERTGDGLVQIETDLARREETHREPLEQGSPPLLRAGSDAMR